MFVSPLQNDITEVSAWWKNVETVSNEWLGVEDRILETHNVYTMSEFICIQCRNS